MQRFTAAIGIVLGLMLPATALAQSQDKYDPFAPPPNKYDPFAPPPNKHDPFSEGPVESYKPQKEAPAKDDRFELLPPSSDFLQQRKEREQEQKKKEAKELKEDFETFGKEIFIPVFDENKDGHSPGPAPTGVPAVTPASPMLSLERPSGSSFGLLPKHRRPQCAPIAMTAWSDCGSADENRVYTGCTTIVETSARDRGCMAEAYFLRGTAYAKAGNYERAIADLSEAVEMDWYFAPAYVNRGLALEAIGAIELSKRDYELTVLIPPETELERRSHSKAQQRLSAAKGQVSQLDFVSDATPVNSGPAPRNDDLGASGPEPWNDGLGSQGPTFGAPSQEVPQKEPYETVKVFYATDRKRTESDKPNQTFGEARGILTFGVCEVSIPASHETGQLEGAIIEYFEDPQRHIVLQKVSKLEGEEFWGSLRSRIEASPGRNAFIYVHGFNTSFRDAARRTAQLHKDLEFNGAPVFFSWPSQASPLSYVVDLANAEWSVSTLKIFLKDFATTSSADRTFVIAHSMGTKVLTNAMARLVQEDPVLAAKFSAIILAAPDIDSDVFIRDLAPQLSAAGANVVLYTSSSDQALWTSRQLHGFRRAGDSSEGPLVVKGVDTIDTQDIDTSLLGHSYYAGVKAVLADIKRTFTGAKASEREGLKMLAIEPGAYWQISAAP